MGEQKVTEMVLKVDLQCEKCYKKVKKILCKFPQIRDQTYDEKNNQVIIKVVCCSPEKIRDKLCCKGRGTIISIEILPQPKPKPTPSPPPPPPPPPTYPPVTVNVCCMVCYGWHPGCPCQTGYDGYYGRRIYATSSNCVTRTDYFSEENPQACAIM